MVEWSFACSGGVPCGCCSPPCLVGVLPTAAGWVVPCPPWRRVLWLPPLALLVRGMPLVSVACFPSLPSGGLVRGAPPLARRGAGAGPVGAVLCLPWWWSRGRCGPPSLAGVWRWVGWGGLPSFLVVSPVAAVRRLAWLGGLSVLVGWLLAFLGGGFVAVGPWLPRLVGWFWWGGPPSHQWSEPPSCVFFVCVRVWCGEGALLRCAPAVSCSLVARVSLFSPSTVWGGGFASSSLCPPSAGIRTGPRGAFRLVCPRVGFGRGLCPGSVGLVVFVHAWAGAPSSWVGVRF